MGTRFVRCMATLLGLLLACCVLGGCAPQLSGAVRSPHGPAPVLRHDMLADEDVSARLPLRVHELLAKADDPKDPIWPRAHLILATAQINGLPILLTVYAAPNLRPRHVESAAATGELTNFAKQPGSSFLGAVGEALVIHELGQQHTAKGVMTITPQPTAAQLPAGFPKTDPDLKVEEKGYCIAQLGLFDVQRTVSFPDTIGPGTGGRVMTRIYFGPNTVVSYWEITTSTRFEFIRDRAKKVAGWATALGGFSYPGTHCKCGQKTVYAAVLAIDRGAYFGLTPAEQTTIVNIVTSAGGFIRLFRDLTKNSLQHAKALAAQLAPVSRP